MSTTTQPPKPLSDIAVAIRKQLRDGAAERGLGLSEWDVAFLANRVLRALPKVRDREQVQVHSRRSGPEKPPEWPLAASNPGSGSADAPEGLSPRERRLQRLRADPTDCAVLQYLAEGLSNRVIAERLELTIHQARRSADMWSRASEQAGRAALCTWARQQVRDAEEVDQ